MVSLPLRLALLRPPPSPSVLPSRSHTGYIAFEGRMGVRDDLRTREHIQSLRLDLQPVKRITFRLNPFTPDCKGIRNLMFDVSHLKTRATNPKCVVKTEILSDGGPQEIRVELNDELEMNPIVFRAGTLTRLEMLYELNKMVLPLVKKKDDSSSGVTTKKAAKMAGKKR